LALDHVTFHNDDVTAVNLDGSSFFLYAPFSGDMLLRAVGRLELVASRRPIVISAVGFELSGVSWLKGRSTSVASLTIYDSR
jgi:hypothetical protein